MEKRELIQVYAYARSIWGSFKKPSVNPDASVFDEVWFDVLHPYPKSLICLAMKEYSKDSDFCNISKVGELCKSFAFRFKGIDEVIVLEEIRQNLSTENFEENFEKLSPFTQSIVGYSVYLKKWSGSAFSETLKQSIRKRVREKIENFERAKLQKTLKTILMEDKTLKLPDLELEEDYD